MISVITVTFNASSFIKQTIESVCSQKNKGFEFLLIDGASKDDTVSKVKSMLAASDLLPNNIIILSERDRGMVDAMNKGVRMAKGDYILFLNGGDSFYDDDVINRLESVIATHPADAIYGQTMMLFYEGKGIYKENEEFILEIHNRLFKKQLQNFHMPREPQPASSQQKKSCQFRKIQT